MGLSAIDGSLPISNLAATTPQSVARRASSIPPAPAVGAAASTQISGPGQLFGRLQQLAEQDPTKFKAVAQNIADEIRKAAQQSSGKAAEFENKLADRFDAAAKSGDFSALKPPAAPGGSEGAQHAHHHHHHGGGAGGGPIAAIFASALSEVNQALGSTPAADTTGAEPQAAQTTAT